MPANSTDTDTLRVGRVNFLNTLPFFHDLSRQEVIPQRWSWDDDVPAALNQKMREGSLDVALVSSLEYALAQEQYDILAPICIGIKHQSDSVVLVSKKPIEKLNKIELTLPKESLSSSSLLKILFKQKYGFENTFVTKTNHIEDVFENNEAGLLIGDAALFQKELAPYHYDLGLLWRDWKKKPFCFALWVAQKGLTGEKRKSVDALKHFVMRTLQYNLYHLEELIDCLRQEYALEESDVEKTINYFTHLNYWLDEEMIGGLMDFYQCAQALNLAPACSKLSCFGEKK